MSSPRNNLIRIRRAYFIGLALLFSLTIGACWYLSGLFQLAEHRSARLEQATALRDSSSKISGAIHVASVDSKSKAETLSDLQRGLQVWNNSREAIQVEGHTRSIDRDPLHLLSINPAFAQEADVLEDGAHKGIGLLQMEGEQSKELARLSRQFATIEHDINQKLDVTIVSLQRLHKDLEQHIRDVLLALTTAILLAVLGFTFGSFRPAMGRFDLAIRESERFSEELTHSLASATLLQEEAIAQKSELEANQKLLDESIEQLQQSQSESDRLSNLLQHALGGIGRFDVKGYVVSANRAFAELFGSSIEQLVGQPWEILFPDSEVDRMNTAFREMTRNRSAKVETLGKRADGNEVFVEVLLQIDEDSEGKFRGYFCFFRDIDSQRRAEATLRERESLLKTISDATPIGIFVTDTEGNCLHINPTYSLISGLSEEECQGKGWLQSIHPDDRDLVTAQWYLCAMERRPYSSRHRFLQTDGSFIWARVQAVEMTDSDGAHMGYVGTVEDITETLLMQTQLEETLVQVNESNIELEEKSLELEAANAKLARLAETDGLTGLLNHRTFQQRLVTFAAETGPENPLSVLLMDVDHFKKFNDTFGHPEGDEVLRYVSATICDVVGQAGEVARYGGEEFAVLLPRTQPHQAASLAESIRVAIHAVERHTGRVSVSVGVAWGTTAAECSEVTKQADDALYAAKRGGRNRIMRFDEIVAEAA